MRISESAPNQNQGRIIHGVCPLYCVLYCIMYNTLYYTTVLFESGAPLLYRYDHRYDHRYRTTGVL